VPLDTPPITRSVNSCHLVPIADMGGSRLKSSIWLTEGSLFRLASRLRQGRSLQ
jgi:hypothetical protein